MERPKNPIQYALYFSLFSTMALVREMVMSLLWRLQELILN
jgi:hypothetical protein